VSACLQGGYLVFTFFVVQDEKTVLMIAAQDGASIETMQLLLDSGAVISINAQDKVVLLCFNIQLWI
jgi:ankyrin repeat protein